MEPISVLLINCLPKHEPAVTTLPRHQAPLFRWPLQARFSLLGVGHSSWDSSDHETDRIIKGMKISKSLLRLTTTRVDQTNPRFKALTALPRPIGSFVQTSCNSAVLEERHRLAREIHDTLVQGFAGILLHIEAVGGPNGAGNALECLGRAKELAKCGLEDARRLLLGSSPTGSTFRPIAQLKLTRSLNLAP